MDEPRLFVPLKNALCLFCGCGIFDHQENGDSNSSRFPEISKTKFLEGISLISELLGGKNAAQEWCTSPRWELVGVDNFATYVCCPECYERLDKLINLHQLIVTTQAALNETLTKIQDCVRESQKSEVEYSINACVQFRDVLSRWISGRKVSRREVRRGPRSKTCNHQPTAPAPENHPIPAHHQNPVVLLERLQLPLTPPPHLKKEIVLEAVPLKDCRFDDAVDAPSLSPPHSPTRSISPTSQSSPSSDKKSRIKRGIRKRIVEDDNDYQPSTIKRRARGRLVSRKSAGQNVPKKIGRPRIRPHGARKVRLSAPRSEEIPEEGSGNDEDPDYQPENVVKTISVVPPKIKRRIGRPKSALTRAKVGSPRFFRHLSDGPQDFRPIYMLDSTKGLLMFHNVPIRQSASALECLHPNCSFVEPLPGYFAHQFPLRNMRCHVQSHHRPGKSRRTEDPKFYYFCHLCDTHLESKLLHALHRQEHHPQLVMLPALCEVCGDTFPQADLISHNLSHKNAEEKAVAAQKEANKQGRRSDLTAPLIFPCDECSRVYNSFHDLRRHKDLHIPIELRRKFMCDTCGLKVATRQALGIHKRRAHLRNPPKPPKYVQCQYCDRQFLHSFREKFEAHLRSHTGERPFQCDQCGKSFSSKSALKLHEQRHNELPDSVTCEYCPNSFKNKGYLRRHQVKKHWDLLPDKPDPEKSEKLRMSNPLHIMYGPKQMFPCEPCGHVFRWKSELRNHVKRMHLVMYPRQEDYPDMWTTEHHLKTGATTKRAPVVNRKIKKDKGDAEHDPLE